jgi:hypothetical protein
VNTVLRGALRVLLVILGLLAFVTTYLGIPAFVSQQAALVQSLGGVAALRYVELPFLGFILFLLAIGPARIRTSILWVRNWLNPEPQLRAEIERLVAQNALLESQLRAYESRDGSRIVLQMHEHGPVSMGGLSSPDTHGYTEWWVPYDAKYYTHGEHRPLPTLDVGTLGGDYSICLGHEATIKGASSQPDTSIRVETRLDALSHSGQGEQVFRRLTVYSGEGEVEEDGSEARYKVSCAPTLSLPGGVYSFKVHDRTNALGEMHYRNMHLLIYKLGET